MTNDRVSDILRVCQEALAREGAARAGYLDSACGADTELRREVEALLAESSAGGPGFLDTPPWAPTAPAVVAGLTISHYEVLGRLGTGGMGVVYKAEDRRLDRLVAIKLLAPDVGTGGTPEAQLRRERFMHEAKAASALDHPNIANIHEIDETADGRVFIVMAFYDGESLKGRIARGPLPLEEAVVTIDQVARGLATAHGHGIVHRDIKPANIMVTTEGVAKIIDFGLAKLENVASVTKTGTTVGTVAYMSPEQVRGEAVDARTDLWSLGVVLYQMLTGHLPFRGEHQGSMMRAILEDSPTPITRFRSDTPDELQDLIARALEKDQQRRYASADEIVRDLEQYRARLAMPSAGQPVMRRIARAVHRPVCFVPALLVLLVVGYWTYGVVEHRSRVRWAREEAIPRVIELAKKQDYKAAFDVARQAERYLAGDPVLQQVWSDIAVERALDTTPPAADIYYRDPREPDSPWEHLGRSNSGPLRVPLGEYQFDIRKAGHVTVELSGSGWRMPPNLALAKEGSVPADMVRVPPGERIQMLALANYQAPETIRLGEYFIDKYEVTNHAYKAFVDGGGYDDARYWKHAFVGQGKAIPWKEAMTRFKDKTGRTGPATWEYGRYPDGQDDYPVTGVSWYEAAAYAEFAGKSLPTIYHWAVAADVTFPGVVISLSNFGRAGLAAVGSFRGSRNSIGLYDVAGNAREWCFNATGDVRFVLGAASSDPSYFFAEPDERPAFDRSPETGFRCIKGTSAESIPEYSRRPLTRTAPRDWSKEKPLSDDECQLWMKLFSYEKTPLNARREMVEQRARHSSMERVSFDLPGGNERMVAYLFLPIASVAPYQAVVFWPGASAISQRTSDNGRALVQVDFVSHVIQDGRALLYPILTGTYERGGGQPATRIVSLAAEEPDRLAKQMREIRRCLDYLETREDIDADRLAYYGLSWGAFMGVPVLAAEPRFKAGILMGGGFRGYSNVFGFAQRVRTPVQVVNGRYDSAFPLKTSSEPMFSALGTPAKDKRHVVVECPHVCSPFQPEGQEVVRKDLEWLDRYLGPVRKK